MFKFNPDLLTCMSFYTGSLAANEYILVVHIMEKKVGTLLKKKNNFWWHLSFYTRFLHFSSFSAAVLETFFMYWEDQQRAEHLKAVGW